MLQVQRKFVKIGTEEVQVSDNATKGTAEQKEAAAIFVALKTKYGVDVNSMTLLDGIKSFYPNAPQAVHDMLQTRFWRMIDLRALSESLAFYAPILGAARAKSNRSKDPQELTSAGKAMATIDTNTPAGSLDPDTLGQYLDNKKVLGLYSAHENVTTDFGDERKDLVGTFVHEAAHGLLSYAHGDFMKATGYWSGYFAPTADPAAEPPVSEYGATNLGEDLSETAKFFAVDPNRLLHGSPGKKAGEVGGPAPRRYAFMQQLRTDWLPPVKAIGAKAPDRGDHALPVGAK